MCPTRGRPFCLLALACQLPSAGLLLRHGFGPGLLLATLLGAWAGLTLRPTLKRSQAAQLLVLCITSLWMAELLYSASDLARLLDQMMTLVVAFGLWPEDPREKTHGKKAVASSSTSLNTCGVPSAPPSFPPADLGALLISCPVPYRGTERTTAIAKPFRSLTKTLTPAC